MLHLRLLITAFCLMAAISAVAQEQPTPINHIYTQINGQSLHLQVQLPTQNTSTAKPPLVVWIHGGGWRGGSYKQPKINWVLDHGYALASIQYRFTDVAIFPAQILDCKGAIRWLRAHANELGYDATRIAVGGSSAGAQLALLLGTSGDVKSLEGKIGGNLKFSSRVQGVLNYFGPSDFILRDKSQHEMANSPKVGSFALLGGTETTGVDMKLAYQASPSSYVTQDDPPLITFHGLKDTRVLPDQAQRMTDLYQAASLPVETHLDQEAGHGGKTLFVANYQKAALRFLKQILKPKKK